MNSATIEKPRLTITQSTQLFEIKRLVKSSATVTATGVKHARQHAESALGEALLCGFQLLKAKELLGAANFNEWLTNNFRELHPDIARGYMTLAASQSNDETLATKDGLRDAFIAIGIL